jgi:NADH-quinone oxidoreductase subunit L
MSGSEVILQIAAAAAVLLGLALAYVFFLRRPDWSAKLASSPVGSALGRFWFSGWGFDGMYERLIIHPYVRLAQLNKDDVFDWMAVWLVARPYVVIAGFLKEDFFDRFFSWIGALNAAVARALRTLQSGLTRWYAAGIVVGAILLIAMAVLR